MSKLTPHFDARGVGVIQLFDTCIHSDGGSHNDSIQIRPRGVEVPTSVRILIYEGAGG